MLRHHDDIRYYFIFFRKTVFINTLRDPKGYAGDQGFSYPHKGFWHLLRHCLELTGKTDRL